METDLGIIIIHGFCGSTKEIEPLANKLKSLGYDVLTPSLKGHTGKRKDLKHVSYNDWVNDVEKAYLEFKSNHKDIILIGFSMGGLLSFQLARKYNVKSIITLNTPIYIGSVKNFFKHVVNDIRKYKIDNLKRFACYSYKIPVNAIVNFRKLLSDTKENLNEVTCDVWLNQSTDDETVKPKSINYLHDNIGSSNKNMMMYHESNHMILQSEIAEDVMTDLVKYIKNYQ